MFMDKKKMIIGAVAAALLLIAGIFAVVTLKNKPEEEPEEVALQQEEPKEEEVPEEDPDEDVVIEVVYPDATEEEKEAAQTDPQGTVKTETGAAVNVIEVVSASNVGETATMTFGIDVSRFQGTIDWSQVATSGINFAMIRVGYRDSKTGEIKPDTNAKFNMQEAEKYGIKIGAYFFSTATSTAEAVEEADWVANYIAQYPITYPVGYNCEGFENSSSRQYSLTKDDRSNFAMAFLGEIYKKGYTPIFYASKNELSADNKWNTSSIEAKYKIWTAWYTSDTTPAALAKGPNYSGKCDMWQYSNQGTIPGISKKVDVDIAYFGYSGTETAKDTSERAVASADVEALMKFTDANEIVTAKSKTNLRDKPSQGADSTVKVTLVNGQQATRTGVSTSGWSRVVYEGVTYYAVSSYLTTDLAGQAAAPAPTQEATPAPAEPAPATTGFKTKFTDCNEIITAKEMVNLRNKPSVTDADSVVVATLYAGTQAVRTGYNTEYGWSRVEYNGQVLYCVSSYIKVVQ